MQHGRRIERLQTTMVSIRDGERPRSDNLTCIRPDQRPLSYTFGLLLCQKPVQGILMDHLDA